MPITGVTTMQYKEAKKAVANYINAKMATEYAKQDDKMIWIEH